MEISESPQERRPPLYNPEDYVTGLKKFSKLTGLQLYLIDPDVSKPDSNLNNDRRVTGNLSANNRKNKKGRLRHNAFQDGDSRVDNNREMELRQFSTITELLVKLKSDLEVSFPSFLREFISAPNEGVTCLLDALKSIETAQTNITGSLNQLGSRANHFMLKRALNDEFAALLCIKLCSRSEEGALKLVEHPSGLFTIAVCVMSNFSKSRILSLQLLSRLCDLSNGHKQVSDALSMLRLRFGEPVRFKFLVGMVNSYNSDLFQISCLKFLNRFVETAKDTRERIMIQTELEEAGFEILALKKRVLIRGNSEDSNSEEARVEKILRDEIQRWTHNYIDVNGLVRKLLNAERANRKLREELSKLKSYRSSSKVSCDCCSCDGEDDVLSATDIRPPSKSPFLETSSKSMKTFYDEVSFGEESEDDGAIEVEPACSLVTVLASDGYTCVTSPIRDQQQNCLNNNSSSSMASVVIVSDDHLGPVISDSGLCSDSSEHSTPHSSSDTPIRSGQSLQTETHFRAFPSDDNSESSNFRTYRSDEHSDKSSYSEKQDKETSKEIFAESFEYDENEATYIERNAALDETVSIHNESISVEKLRRKFDTSHQTRILSSPKPTSRHRNNFHRKETPMSFDEDKSQTSIDESVDNFQEISLKSPRLSRFASGDELDIIPKKTPKPPVRRRAKSTPVNHPRNQTADDDKKSEMIFLPDLSDGETSDGGNDVMTSLPDPVMSLESTTNTLETVSASSFGFVRTSPPMRQNDFSNRLRRHQSFLEPSKEDLSTKSPPEKPARHFAMRRSESFHHNQDFYEKSSDHFNLKTNTSSIFKFSMSRPEPNRARGKSVERILQEKDDADPKTRPLHKSKSVEYLKAKLLSKKGTNKTQAAESSKSRSQSPAPPQWNRNEPERKVSMSSSEMYDWRQDTPFWNHRGRWSRPAPISSNKSKSGTATRSIRSPVQNFLHPNPIGNAAPIVPWPGRHYPGLFIGNSSFYPRPFAIANPQNPKNVSHNVFLTPVSQASRLLRPPFLGGVSPVHPGSTFETGPVRTNEDFPARLEITELSDGEEEPMIPAPDYSSTNQATKGRGNILDIPSGLY